MGRRFWVVGLAVVALTLILGFAGWSAFRPSDAAECYACKRPVHAHSRTVATVNGRTRVFCCPACALSQHEQAEKPVTLTQLTSYLTGKALTPAGSFLVKGSDVNMCAHTQNLLDADSRTADLRYDRCAPSLIAFAQRSEAMGFARTHGGEVMPFTEVAAAFSK